jgi:hypothetical protein
MWYDGQQIRFDEIPASLMGPTKPEGTLHDERTEQLRRSMNQGPRPIDNPAPRE